MSTIALVTSDTLGTMSTQSSTHYGTTPATEKKGDPSFTTSTIQSTPSQTVVVDAKLFAQMQVMLAAQMVQAQSQVRNETVTLSDGSKYTGPLNQEGKPHGKGTMIYPSTNPRQWASYEGDFDNGLKHGRGEMKWKNGGSYVGQFINDELRGRGILIYASGNLRLNYEGEIENGREHGQGVLHMANKDKYVGYFNQGATTKGTMTEPTGHYYEGEWKDGQFWEGTYTYLNQHGMWQKRPYNAGEVPCCYNSGTG